MRFPLVLLAVAPILSQCEKFAERQEASATQEFFQTPWQTETEFIVTDILTHFAELAAFGESPGAVPNVAIAVRTLAADADAPLFQTTITTATAEVSSELAISRRIWSPRLYSGLASRLTKALRIPPTKEEKTGETEEHQFLMRLTEFTPEALHRADDELSEKLSRHPTAPHLHARAAILLAALALRDDAGRFTEKRLPLNRAAAHLVFAEALDPKAVNEPLFRLADAMIATASNSQARALELVATLPARFEPWKRILETMATGDWRILETVDRRTRLESIVYFKALTRSLDLRAAFGRMPSAELDEGPEWARIVLASPDPKPPVARILVASGLSRELDEIQSVARNMTGKNLDLDRLGDFLNLVPEGLLSEIRGKRKLAVIPPGLWAQYLQRHLLHVATRTYQDLANAPERDDEARAFRRSALERTDGLRFQPFLARVTDRSEPSYIQAIEQLYELVRARPELVPAGAWNLLAEAPDFRNDAHTPAGTHPHRSEWHSSNPLPGTAYDLPHRLTHSSLHARPDLTAKAESIHAAAPYDLGAKLLVEQTRHGGSPDYRASRELFEELLPFHPAIRSRVASRSTDTEVWMELMLPAAEMLPLFHYEVAERLVTLDQPKAAAKHLEIAMDQWPDDDLIAQHANWLVHHYATHDETEKANALATRAAETGSLSGLMAAATLAERLADYNRAEALYEQIRSRHGDSASLQAFYYRHRARGGVTPRLAAGLYDRMRELFPDGPKQVAIEDLGHQPPTRSIEVVGSNWFTEQAGIKEGSRIVALNGIRVRDSNQYRFVHSLSWEPRLDLIVWQNGQYEERSALLASRRFGVPLRER